MINCGYARQRVAVEETPKKRKRKKKKKREFLFSCSG